MNQSQQQQQQEQQEQQQQAASTEILLLSPLPPPSCTMSSTGAGDDHQLNLRAALALNNMGVSLLCKGSFSSALKTFKDSLAVMKVIVTLHDGEEEEKEEEEEHDDDDNTDKSGLNTTTTTTTTVQDKVQQANARLASKCIPKKQPKKGSSKQQKAAAATTATTYPTVDIVALDDTDIAAIRSAIRYGPCVSMAFPIRCTFLDHHQEQHQQQSSRSRNMDSLQQYYAAMIGYNHGLAHLLAYAPTSSMASSSSSSSLSSPSRKLLSQAFKHLSQAHGLLLRNVQAATTLCTDNEQQENSSSRSSSSSSDVNNLNEQNTEELYSNDDDDTRYFSNLLLLGLVLMSLHVFFRNKTNCQAQTNQVLESLMNLEDAIQEHDVMEGGGNSAAGVMCLSSCSSLTLLCDWVHGASAA